MLTKQKKMKNSQRKERDRERLETKRRISFEERFKNKRQSIGKDGVIEVGQMHVPIIDRSLKSKHKHVKSRYTLNTGAQISHNQTKQVTASSSLQRIHQKETKSHKLPSQYHKLPRISRSVHNLGQYTTIQSNTKQYKYPPTYRSQKQYRKMTGKTNLSDMRSINIIKLSEDPEWEHMSRFSKILENKKKESSVQLQMHPKPQNIGPLNPASIFYSKQKTRKLLCIPLL